MSVTERQAGRLRLLLALYEMADADTSVVLDYRAVAEQAGVDAAEVDRATDYLVDEGLARWVAMGGAIGIAHRGIKEAESALQERPTELFSRAAINIVVVSEGGSVGTLQQGTIDSEQGG